MLKQRVITALALLVVLFGVLTSPSVWAFPVFMTLLVGAAAWEWGRLSGFDGLPALGCAVLAVLAWPFFWETCTGGLTTHWPG